MEKFEITFKAKPETGVYVPERWNAQDANEIQRVFNAFAKAVADALAEKDEQIRALQEENQTIKNQIQLGLVEAGFVQPDYLKPEPANS